MDRSPRLNAGKINVDPPDPLDPRSIGSVPESWHATKQLKEQVYALSTLGQYRTAIEALVELELADGSPKEYWELSPGREGTLQPGRDDYSWNALLVPAFSWSRLIE